MTINFSSKEQRNTFYQEKLQQFLKKHPIPNTLEEKNDYAVQLIYNREYQQAIELLLEIEKKHPDLANTAVNLGTAYELLGQNEQAKFWIEKGLKINPGVHYGSEWIHLNILKAKLHKADSQWLRDNPILGLDFGTAYFPQSQNIHVSRNIDNMDDLAYEAKLQLRERRKFIFGDDLMMSRLAYEAANVEMLRGQIHEQKYQYGFKNEIAYKLASIAKQHGLKTNHIEEKRLKMLLSNSFVYRVYLKVLDFISERF